MMRTMMLWMALRQTSGTTQEEKDKSDPLFTSTPHFTEIKEEERKSNHNDVSMKSPKGIQVFLLHEYGITYS